MGLHAPNPLHLPDPLGLSGGGMSGSSWTPEQAAAASSMAQQLAVQRSMDKINSIFDNPSRQQQYSDLGAATTQYYTDQLNQQKAKNDLALKFALARGGQTGGSQQVYDAGLANQDYTRGLLQAGLKGQQAASGLQQADEQARAQLLAAAQGGLDVGNSGQQAAEALQSDLANAKAGATVDQLGNVFGDFADLYNRSLQAAQDRQANQYLYNLLYGKPQGGFD